MNTHLMIPNWDVPPNVKACITTRMGGESLVPYATNNVGLHVGDDANRVQRNRTALCAHLGLTKTPQWLEQVHGTEVVAAEADGLVRTADACYTGQVGLACVVMTADCLPVLLCDEQATQVAAVHCGWRSLAAGILEKTLKKFTSTGPHLRAYLGPAISQPNFEVGPEVFEAFLKLAQSPKQAELIAAAFVASVKPGYFYADIYALAKAELQALGVTRIQGGGHCTFQEKERFYSYRRDKVTGRMASLIWLES